MFDTEWHAIETIDFYQRDSKAFRLLTVENFESSRHPAYACLHILWWVVGRQLNQRLVT